MNAPERRHRQTLSFLLKCLTPPARLLDLGVENPFAQKMRQSAYEVINTPDVDLDYVPEAVCGHDVQAATAFEILEHLVNRFAVLKNIDASRLIATVPLRLWFTKAYFNPHEPYDQHFHEFEQWQFNRLLEKTCWQIIRSECWTSPAKKIGLRSLLQHFTPRYYAIETKRVC